MKGANKILLAISLISLAVALFSIKSCETAKRKLESRNNLTEWLQDSIKTYRDREGKLISEVKTLEADIEYIKTGAQLTNNKYLSALAEIKKIKHGAVISSQTGLDTITRVKVITDTITNTCSFDDSIKNDYLYLKESLRGDTMHRTIYFTDTISYALIEVKNGTIVRIKNESPYVINKDIKSFTVKKKKRSLAGRIAEYIAVAGVTWLVVK